MKQQKFISLNMKLVILTLVIITFVTTAISVSIYRRTSKMIDQSYTKEIDSKIEIINGQISDLLKSTERLADNMISLDIMKTEMDKESEKLLYRYLKTFTENYPETVNITFLRDDRQYIYPRDPYIENSPPIETAGYNDRMTGPDVKWYEPFIDSSTSEWVMSYTKLVYEKEKVIGYVEVKISLDHLQEVIASHQIGKSGSLYIVNSEGVILISAYEGLINVDIPDQQLKAFMVENENGSFNYESSTNEKYAKFSTNDDGLGWKILGIVSQEEIDKEVYQMQMIIILYAVVFGALGTIIMIMTASRMAARIRELTKAINRLGEGGLDYELTIHSKDEIGLMSDAYNDAVGKIRSLIATSQGTCNALLCESHEMSGIASEATGSTNYIAECIQNISNDSISQSETTESLNSNFQELSQAMDRVSGSIQEIHEIVKKTQNVSNEAMDVVTNLHHMSSNMTQSTNIVKDTIDSIGLTTKDIYSIVQTINEISEQTNLLALNASIEAARAGENGKGFAVVAEEVRKLAENTADSVVEIKTLIEKIQGQADNAVSEIVEVTDNTFKQTSAVEATRASFQSLGSSIGDINGSVQKIDELNHNMMSVKSLMENLLSDITAKIQNNADNTSNISSLTEEQLASMVNLEQSFTSLTESVQKMEQEIHVFKINTEE